MPVIETTLRVPYADTDQMGMVYYANYLVYFERGRTEWLRAAGLRYKDLEDRGVYFPVIECSCSYRASARYDDILAVRTWLAERGPASLTFAYEVVCDGRTLATGTTRHPLVDKTFKPVRFPPDLRAALDTAYEKKDTDR